MSSTRLDVVGDTLTRTATLPASTANLTVCLFCRIAVDRNSNSAIFCIDLSTTSGQFLILETDADGTTMGLWNSGGPAATGPNMVVGRWYFLAFTINGTAARLYYCDLSSTNPNQLTLVTGTVAAGFAPTTIRVGSSNFGGEFWNGNVCGVRLWTATLPQQDLENEMAQLAPVRTDDLWAFWPLCPPQRTAPIVTVDESGNGRHLTQAGTFVTEDGPSVPWRATAPMSPLYIPF